jgi:hypothetical protein
VLLGLGDEGAMPCAKGSLKQAKGLHAEQMQ